eukprot:4640528-Pleurochrysis_carterae.AAC.1
MLALLEERGLVKNLDEAVGSVARADEVRLDCTVALALAETLAWSACSKTAEPSIRIGVCSATVELGADGVEQMTKKVAKECVPLGSNTDGSTGSLSRTDGKI